MNDQTTNQNEFINNLFSVNFVLTTSDKVKQLDINISDLLKQTTQINSLSGKLINLIDIHHVDPNSSYSLSI